MNLILHLSSRSLLNPARFLEKVYKYPRINFQVPHLAIGVQEIILAVKEFDNLYLDTSACTHWMNRRVFRTPHRKIISAFPEKILFGSDEPWASYEAEIEEVNGLDISDNDKEKIFSRNFEKLWG
jgi:predicted TIM-barrel fold metal-dependent hydrolase